MPIRLLDFDLHILNMRNRMPFRYGIVTMTALPHLFLQARVEMDGKEADGIAAEGLAPKWFTKVPDSSMAQDITEMLDVIQAACRRAQEAGAADTVFDLWQATYQAQESWAADTDYPPLLWAFGVSLVERAIIDGFCRATGTTFAEAVRTNSLGMRLAESAAGAGRAYAGGPAAGQASGTDHRSAYGRHDRSPHRRRSPGRRPGR